MSVEYHSFSESCRNLLAFSRGESLFFRINGASAEVGWSGQTGRRDELWRFCSGHSRPRSSRRPPPGDYIAGFLPSAIAYRPGTTEKYSMKRFLVSADVPCGRASVMLCASWVNCLPSSLAGSTPRPKVRAR